MTNTMTASCDMRSVARTTNTFRLLCARSHVSKFLVPIHSNSPFFPTSVPPFLNFTSTKPASKSLLVPRCSEISTVIKRRENPIFQSKGRPAVIKFIHFSIKAIQVLQTWRTLKTSTTQISRSPL